MSDQILDQFKENQIKTEIDTSKKLRVGIIGTGGIANAHIKQYLQMPDVELVAGCDLVPGKAAEFFKKYGVEAKTEFRDYIEMLDTMNLDCVSICTYNRTHKECTVAALERGVHVLLEKPMSVTTEEAAEIIRAEKKSGKVLSIGFQPRFDANMQMIKKIVQSGELGQVYYIQTGGGRRRGIPASNGKTSFIMDETAGIGALGDIGCYSLDMVLNAIGYPKPLTVTGYKSALFGTSPDYPYADSMEPYAKKFSVDDFAAAFIRLEGGIVLDFRIAWAMNINTPGDTIILGTKGGLRIPSTDCWNGTVGGPMTVYHQVAGECTETVIPVLPGPKNGLFYEKVRTFLDAVKNGTPSPIPSSQILYNQAIIDSINKSAELGKEIEVEIPEI